jgi:hypothetical protein
MKVWLRNGKKRSNAHTTAKKTLTRNWKEIGKRRKTYL